MPERQRRITSHRDDGGYRTIDLAIEDDGALRFTGRDIAPGSEMHLRSGGYEYFLVLGPSAVARLGEAIGVGDLAERRDLLDVVTSALHDHAFTLRTWFDDHDIEYDFHSYAG
jgi:hypothetical protein